jgi:hypothetical protein
VGGEQVRPGRSRDRFIPAGNVAPHLLPHLPGRGVIPVVERGDLTGVDYPGRTPKTIKTVCRQQVGFRIDAERSRFSEWAVCFRPH